MLDATITTFMIYAAAAISLHFCSAEMGGMLREKSDKTGDGRYFLYTCSPSFCEDNPWYELVSMYLDTVWMCLYVFQSSEASLLPLTWPSSFPAELTHLNRGLTS
jgi:hypothetical protein